MRHITKTAVEEPFDNRRVAACVRNPGQKRGAVDGSKRCPLCVEGNISVGLAGSTPDGVDRGIERPRRCQRITRHRKDRETASDCFLVRGSLIQTDQDHLPNHQVNAVGTVGHGLEGCHHCRIRHSRMHDNGVQRTGREQPCNIISRESGVGSPGIQCRLAPPVERHMHERRLDNRSCVRVYCIMPGTMKVVSAGHSPLR